MRDYCFPVISHSRVGYSLPQGGTHWLWASPYDLTTFEEKTYFVPIALRNWCYVSLS